MKFDILDYKLTNITYPTIMDSSIDGLLWDEDSKYFYYLHGPLARVEYGEDKVQGQDYVYTLQGWLKAVNFKGEDAINIEPGVDGNININAHTNKLMGRDAYGYVLGYNDEDYTAINANNYNFGLDWNFLGQEVMGIGNKKGLYNGNIATMATDLKGLVNEPLTAYAYKYDQLNRIKNANNAGLHQGAFLFRGSYSSQYNYDKDGNITTLLRAGSTDMMDDLQYNYSGGNTNSSNKLIGITDAVSSSNFPNDLENTQYTYDAIGNLLTDSHEGLSVGWDVFNKIKSIYLPNKEIYYEYDPNGNRALKVRVGLPGTMNEGDCTEYYVRDPQGNILSIYSKKSEINEPLQSEVNLYGSNRLGSYKVNRQGFANEPYLSIQDAYRYRTQKYYELSNHLGNVLTTISDRKLGYNISGSSAKWYEPEILTATDYDPFGMQLDDRQLSSSNYRFGFNGKENDNDVKGDGNQQDYGFRIYDPRVGRFLSVDPLTKSYPELTPYQFASNSPIAGIDMDGLEFTFFSSAGWWLETTPYLGLMEESAVIPRNAIEPFVENMGKVGKNNEIDHISVSGEGSPGLPPRYNPNLSKGENWSVWKNFGSKSEKFIKESTKFGEDYIDFGNVIKELKNLKPDGFSINRIEKLIKIGEIKPGTKSGIVRGIKQIEKYIKTAKENFPDYKIEAELYTYRVIAPVNLKDFNLSKFLKDNKIDMETFKKNNPDFNYVELKQNISMGTVGEILNKK